MLSSFNGLFGVARGDTPPWVLALHGWDRSHSDFDSVLCGAEGRCIESVALDLPGFGATPPPAQAWGSAEYAAAIAPLLAQMAADRGSKVVLLGHSLGGRVAVQLAAQSPDLVSGMVLAGTPLLSATPGGTRSPLAFRLARWAYRRRMIGDRTMETYRQRYGSADYRAATGVMRQVLVRMVNERYEEVMSKLSCPVELVWGERDTEVPLQVGQRAATMLACASLTVCPGVGHMIPLEQPLVLAGLLERMRP